MDRKANRERKIETERTRQASKPHVVLGIRPGQDEKWRQCDLAKVLVTPEKIANAAPMITKISAPPDSSSNMNTVSNVDVKVPQYLNYGIDGTDDSGAREDKTRLFFDHLPGVSIKERLESTASNSFLRKLPSANFPTDQQEKITRSEMLEAAKAQQLAKLVDLKNANARGIAFENKRRIIAEFSPSGDISDSGYPEVQGSCCFCFLATRSA